MVRWRHLLLRRAERPEGCLDGCSRNERADDALCKHAAHIFIPMTRCDACDVKANQCRPPNHTHYKQRSNILQERTAGEVKKANGTRINLTVGVLSPWSRRLPRSGQHQ